MPRRDGPRHSPPGAVPAADLGPVPKGLQRHRPIIGLWAGTPKALFNAFFRPHHFGSGVSNAPGPGPVQRILPVHDAIYPKKTR